MTQLAMNSVNKNSFVKNSLNMNIITIFHLSFCSIGHNMADNVIIGGESYMTIQILFILSSETTAYINPGMLSITISR